jgi:hypothetical protein
MYIEVNGVKTFLVTKLKEEKTQKKNCMMMWHVIPHYINLGLHISMS